MAETSVSKRRFSSLLLTARAAQDIVAVALHLAEEAPSTPMDVLVDTFVLPAAAILEALRTCTSLEVSSDGLFFSIRKPAEQDAHAGLVVGSGETPSWAAPSLDPTVHRPASPVPAPLHPLADALSPAQASHGLLHTPMELPPSEPALPRDVPSTLSTTSRSLGLYMPMELPPLESVLSQQPPAANPTPSTTPAAPRSNTPLEAAQAEPALPQNPPSASTPSSTTPAPAPRPISRHVAKSSSTVFVGNVDARVTESVLAELFAQCGAIDDVLIPTDPRGMVKGFAFVDYCDDAAVPYACGLLDGVAMYGRLLRVQPALDGNG